MNEWGECLDCGKYIADRVPCVRCPECGAHPLRVSMGPQRIQVGNEDGRGPVYDLRPVPELPDERAKRVHSSYEKKCRTLGLEGTGVKISRVRGCIVLATPKPYDHYRFIETKHYPAGTVGALEYPHGVRYVRATVPLDWKPGWRKTDG